MKITIAILALGMLATPALAQHGNSAAGFSSPGFTGGHEINNLSGTFSGDIVSALANNTNDNGPPFYGYNPHLLEQGERAIGRAQRANFFTVNRGAIPGFIVKGDFYSTQGSLVIRNVEARGSGSNLRAVMVGTRDNERPRARPSTPRRTPDARPTPNPDRPSLGNKGNKGNKKGGGKSGKNNKKR